MLKINFYFILSFLFLINIEFNKRSNTVYNIISLQQKIVIFKHFKQNLIIDKAFQIIEVKIKPNNAAIHNLKFSKYSSKFKKI